jgi:hypothetical protein
MSNLQKNDKRNPDSATKDRKFAGALIRRLCYGRTLDVEVLT